MYDRAEEEISRRLSEIQNRIDRNEWKELDLLWLWTRYLDARIEIGRLHAKINDLEARPKHRIGPITSTGREI